MKQITDSKQLQDVLGKLKRRRKTIGFVPTMGALHEGHLSLVRKSRKQNDITVVSIFVNPTQFGPKEDFKKYPRPLRKDSVLLKKAEVNFIFTPTPEGMYPEGLEKKGLSPAMKAALSLTKNLCGKFRPGHFEGVMIVVEKLFRIVQPSRAYFGAKDYQQAAVIQKMNEGLPFKIKIYVEPTIREKDGLAMSSRNQYLSPEERKRALAVSQTLFEVRRKILAGEKNLKKPISEAHRKLALSVDSVQYLEIVDPETLKPLSKVQKKMVVLTACYVGKTRLIDNVIIRTS
ncbi:MAG: pantoate--beta-alanine ligase [Candidatus Omnitrophica bacterium]|nr:pantoate--beta-alanine ligase [Candidatus Omnitrophota bacterium]